LALFGKKVVVMQDVDGIEKLEIIRKDKQLIAQYARNTGAMKALVREIKMVPDWPHSDALMEAIASCHEISRNNLIIVHDYFIKKRAFDKASGYLPGILEEAFRFESLFAKLKNALVVGSRARTIVSLEDQDLWNVGRILRRQPGVLLKIPQVRAYIARRRRQELIHDIYQLDASDGKHSINKTVSHNLETMDTGADNGARTELLLAPLVAIDSVRKKVSELKVLAIGPRSESELFSIWAAGFHPENVVGLDLISYTPLIDQGDMHELPYPAGEFDVVIAGWVLAYSDNNKLVAEEIMRVSKSGAFVAVGCAYSPSERNEAEVARTGMDPTRFSKVEDITCLFEEKIDRVMFYGEPAIEADQSKGAGQVTTVFRFK